MFSDRLRLLVALVLGLMACLAGETKAGFITYTIDTGGDGHIGAVAFHNANLTLKFVGDTDNVVNPQPGVYYNSIGTATVLIDGLGSATFTEPITVYATGSYVGFINGSSYSPNQFTLGIINLNALGSSGYDLGSSFGPSFGGGFTSFTTAGFATDRGAFILPPGSGTFTALASAVPEPSSFALCTVAGLSGLFLALTRRGRGEPIRP